MSYLIRTLGNNWKKTIFFTVVGYVGADILTDRYRSFRMMRELSLEALAYGKKPLPFGAKSKHITMLVNPVADNRKGRDKFEKFAEPLIHLSGFLVSTVKTEKIAEARELVELIEKTNIIAIVGGDGTVMEVVTGLLRRDDAEEAIQRFPIAVIPVGTHNSFAASSLQYNSGTPKAAIAQAAMNISRHHIEPKDVIKVELIEPPEVNVELNHNEINNSDDSEASEEENLKTKNQPEPIQPVDSLPENPQKIEKKPYYSMHGVQLGRFREAEKREDNMPRFLNQKLRTFWSLFRTPNVECKAELRYLPHCDGCSKCKEERLRKVKPQQSFLGRILSAFRPPASVDEKLRLDASNPKWKSTNPNCGLWESLCVNSAEFNVVAQGEGKLEIQIGKRYSTIEFLREGFRRKYKGIYDFNRRILCSDIQIFPIAFPENYSIDHEDFPVEPIRMKVLRDKVYFFTPPPQTQL